MNPTRLEDRQVREGKSGSWCRHIEERVVVEPRWSRRSAVATWETVLHLWGCHCGEQVEQWHVERSLFVVFVRICMFYVMLTTMAMIRWTTTDWLTLRTSCSPCAAPGEMRRDSLEGGFSSSDFRSFCLVDFPHFSNIFLMSPFDSSKRQNMTLTVFKVHFFFGFLVFLSSEFYAFLQYIFLVSPYDFAIHHSFGNYDLSSRFIKQPVYVL